MVFESEMDEAQLRLKESSLARILVINSYRFLKLALRLLLFGSIRSGLYDPLEKILQGIIFRNYLGIDPDILYLREKLLTGTVASDKSEFPVKDKISVCAELIYLLLNAQINVIYRRSRDNIIKEQCADKIEERDKVILHREDISCQIDQQHS